MTTTHRKRAKRQSKATVVPAQETERERYVIRLLFSPSTGQVTRLGSYREKTNEVYDEDVLLRSVKP